MTTSAALRGLTTVTFFADDLDAARAWYTEVFGIEPYFVREGAYLEWRIGDYQHEFGVLNSRFAPHPHSGRPGGAIVYWAVDDVEAACGRLLSLGALPHGEPTERGAGYVTASVLDPFGNILGVMLNQHYQDMLPDQRR
ncbi:catechol 2,3-dioxygenase-like lactoylglutathione lyase family enzyme [Actinoplanes tereljensis]|uniref:Glyoxalase n=1 Tax=Paractinoplanes tereljensis TaxID=571912 RepID=A0A919TXV8_9ACTN|nr:VOC family protein [Actinoplanes tereljensis]GIF26781.1 glyoxalase [Actinoplanes tereljensis]